MLIINYINGNLYNYSIKKYWYIIINKENSDKLLKTLKLWFCKINNNKLKYKLILSYINELINDWTIIIKNTLFNIKTIKKTDNGFYYINNLGISIHCFDKITN